MDSHAHDAHDHPDGLAKYGVVFVCLCVLTACSFMTTQAWWPFEKAPTWIFMMGVSCVKAMLVILFFMHLLWEANWKFVLTIPAAMMSVFLLLMLIPDVGNRGAKYSEERTIYAAERAAPSVYAGGHETDDAGDEHANDVNKSDHGDAIH